MCGKNFGVSQRSSVRSPMIFIDTSLTTARPSLRRGKMRGVCFSVFFIIFLFADDFRAILEMIDSVAVRVVNNIMLGSEAIVGILRGTGLELGQIAVAAPRLQVRTWKLMFDNLIHIIHVFRKIRLIFCAGRE